MTRPALDRRRYQTQNTAMITVNRSPHVYTLLVSAGLLLVAFGLWMAGLTSDSFWLDEGYSAWVVHDSTRPPDGLRETLRAVRDSLLTTLERTRSDVHPPLYYLLLDGWSMLTGTSDFALRLPSTLLAVLASAATIALGRLWAGWRAGWFSSVIFITHGFVVYYAHDVRMYGLYLALATSATLAYSLWWKRRGWVAIIVYALVGVALLYTHYTGSTVLLVHGIHALLTLPRRSRRWPMLIAAYAVMALVFALWLPIVWQQFQSRSGLVVAGALPADWGTVTGLYLVLTSGYWGIFALALLMSRRTLAFFLDVNWRAIGLLLALWGLLPPLLLLIATAYGLPIFQLRYVIAIVPATALLIGIALSSIWGEGLRWRHAGLVIGIIFVAWIAYTQLATYRQFWPEKPRWREAITQVDAARNGLEPLILYADPRSPLMHYDRQLQPLGGIRLDLYWRSHSPAELDAIVERFGDDRLWLIAEMVAPVSWDALHAIESGRGVGYRDSVQGTILYRFDTEQDNPLRFSFGDVLAIDDISALDDIGCVMVNMTAQTAFEGSYVMGLHLTRGYNEVISETAITLSSTSSETRIERELCLTMPEGIETNTYHLRLTIQDTGARLPLLESGLLWGDYLLVDTLEVR